MDSADALPLYLETAQAFRAFMADEFEGLTTVKRGDRFADAGLRFLAVQDWAKDYPGLRLNPKKAGELGRDIISDEDQFGSVVFGEAKYSLEGVDELDGVLSKWHELEHRYRGNDQMLFATEPPTEALPK